MITMKQAETMEHQLYSIVIGKKKGINKMIECNQCDEIISHYHYLKFNDVTYYFCENCYFEYMDESEVTK